MSDLRSQLIRLAACEPQGSVLQAALLSVLHTDKKAAIEKNVKGKHIFDHAQTKRWGVVYEDASIHDNVLVTDKAKVHGKAKITGHVVISASEVASSSKIEDKARILNGSKVWGHDVLIQDDALVDGSSVHEEVHVADKAQILNQAILRHYAIVHENAIIDGGFVTEKGIVGGRAHVDSKAHVKGTAKVYGDALLAQKASALDDAEVYGQAIAGGPKTKIYGKVFGRSVISNSVIHANAQISGDAELEDCIVGGEGGEVQVVGGKWKDMTIIRPGRWSSPAQYEQAPPTRWDSDREMRLKEERHQQFLREQSRYRAEHEDAMFKRWDRQDEYIRNRTPEQKRKDDARTDAWRAIAEQEKAKREQRNVPVEVSQDEGYNLSYSQYFDPSSYTPRGGKRPGINI